MKDFETFAEEILEVYSEDPFSGVSVFLGRKGTRKEISKGLQLPVDRRIVSQLESEVPEEESWEYLYFLVEETRKWEILDAVRL